MYWTKSQFDESVARHIPGLAGDIVVGMVFSHAPHFKAAGKRLKVLNYINYRPTYYNHHLRELAELDEPTAEMIAKWVASAVEEEMELADVILVPSGFVANQMPEYGNKLVGEPYGVDTTRFIPKQRTNNINTETPPFTVLFVGQISQRNGISSLIAAATQTRRVKFLMLVQSWRLRWSPICLGT